MPTRPVPDPCPGGYWVPSPDDQTRLVCINRQPAERSTGPDDPCACLPAWGKLFYEPWLPLDSCARPWAAERMIARAAGWSGAAVLGYVLAAPGKRTMHGGLVAAAAGLGVWLVGWTVAGRLDNACKERAP